MTIGASGPFFTFLVPPSVSGFAGDSASFVRRYFLHPSSGRRQTTFSTQRHGRRVLSGDLAVLGLVDDVLENAES